MFFQNGEINKEVLAAFISPYRGYCPKNRVRKNRTQTSSAGVKSSGRKSAPDTRLPQQCRRQSPYKPPLKNHISRKCQIANNNQ